MITNISDKVFLSFSSQQLRNVKLFAAIMTFNDRVVKILVTVEMESSSHFDQCTQK